LELVGVSFEFVAFRWRFVAVIHHQGTQILTIISVRGRMRCHCCNHEHAAEIDVGLSRGVPVTELAQRFGVSTDSLQRHRLNHLSPQLMAQLALGSEQPIDLDRLREDEGASLLSNLVRHRARLLKAMDAAEAMNDLGVVARLSAQIHQNLEICGKLLGSLVNRHEITRTNILVSADYIALRQTLVAALKPYPDAARAVAAALHGLEAVAAKVISTKQQQKLIEHEPIEPSASDVPFATGAKTNS
jgi:hypothetical protein